ncbi:MAG: FKBP-type peptidyl-prolyl cis-trans isomerase [Flavobacteriales bacterium]|nr:hypothetical protein [Flavobacteriales bacterium]MCC6577738.1 FKBP-type peptidyl-prolyl cis-trans isomerase [Flavobacteriales bacterium]NUQ15332.1 FKBP-type peptidyl-prolyl cis-trans isomerase [Flavobacteriales bacterium]
MKTPVLAATLLLLLVACDRGPHPGFKEVAPGVYFRLLGLGGQDSALAADDSVLLRLRASAVGAAPGSLFSTERWYVLRDVRQGAWSEVWRRLHEGDSASTILRAEGLPWRVLMPERSIAPADTLQVQVELAVLQALSPDQQRRRAEERRAADPQGAERRELHSFLAASREQWTRWGTSDLHYRLGPRTDDTLPVQAGDRVTIRYAGTRLEGGEPFDDSDRQGQPFSFRFGDPDQVLKGVEVAVSLLRPGQQGHFLLPSVFAFGGRGAPPLVRPHEPVLYTVQLLAVERGARPGT